MGNLIASMFSSTVLATTTKESSLVNRIFGLDMQLLVDVAIMGLAIFVLFLILSYLLFNPARELLQKRQDRIKEEMDSSAKDKKEAAQLRTNYEAKIKEASREVDEILSEGRKKALKRENDIVDEAKVEASRIIDRANKEIELNKSKMKDEVKQEMIAVASVMAGKIIAGNIDETKQKQLIDEALNEMGDETWQN